MSGPNTFSNLAGIPILQKLFQTRRYCEAIEALYTRALQGPIIGPVSGVALTPALDSGALTALQNETNALIDLLQPIVASIGHVDFTAGIKPQADPGGEVIGEK